MRCNPSCDASLTPCPFPGVSPIAISGSRRGRRPSSLGRQPDRVAVVSHSRARLAVTPSEPRAHDPWSRLRRWATVSDSAITTAATATTHVSAWFGRGAGPPASGVSPIAISAFAQGAGPPASGVSPFPDPARPVRTAAGKPHPIDWSHRVGDRGLRTKSRTACPRPGTLPQSSTITKSPAGSRPRTKYRRYFSAQSNYVWRPRTRGSTGARTAPRRNRLLGGHCSSGAPPGKPRPKNPKTGFL
jgi:hypothetical protein